jgi:serpin B
MKRVLTATLALAFCLITGAVAAALSGCSTPTALGTDVVPAGKPAQTSAAVVGEALPRAIDDFGLDLLKRTAASGNANGNVIVSPLSVHAALSMTANGAVGDTAQQMRTVLRTASMGQSDANAQWAALLGGLATRSTEQELDVANALFANKSVVFKEPFLSADRDYFGAQVSALDFAKDDVPGVINGWVSKNTKGMIPKIMDTADPNAILYLANAVYFKGDWVAPFKHESTSRDPFTRADGTKVDVDMMHMSGTLPYAENGSLVATKLLYKGLDASFYVMLPRPGVSLDAARASLEGTGFSELRAGLAKPDPAEVILALPKLNTSFGTNLNQPLIDMGMPKAFDDKQADFSGMASLDVPIWIGRVLHRTKVIVDEKGTEAAAATVVEMTAGSAMPVAAPQQIICDRPYLFAIVDEKTGTMLFVGEVGDPTK